MPRFTTKTLFSLFCLGVVSFATTDLQACPRSGGGGYYRSAPSYQRSYNHPSYNNYNQPVYQSSNSRGVVQSRAVISQPALQPEGQQAPQAQSSQQGLQQQAQQQQTAKAPAQQSALQMLESFQAEAPQAAATPVQPQGFNGIGIWTATLANGAVVQLNMQADGSFIWTAVSKGKKSIFQGSYNLTDTSLTLNRSNDNQKLEGSLTANGDGFTLKIKGTSDAGLNFSRS